jgi:mevalonate pyrophosphate decarboxylase
LKDGGNCSARTLICMACESGRLFSAQGLLDHTRAKHGDAAADALLQQRGLLPTAAGSGQATAGTAAAAPAVSAAAAAVPGSPLPPA